MNKKVIFILFITIVALALLYLFSFGPLASTRQSAHINPASSRPAPAAPVQVQNKTVQFSAYHNKDLAENYYGIQVPQDWSIKPDQPGSYALTFQNGSGKVYLQDVADNTTLELFILSQDEPQLKQTLANYQRINYQKLTVNNNQAYQLIYESSVNGAVHQTVRTYIAGPDHAGVVELSAPQSSFDRMNPVFQKAINSFVWENGK